MSYHRHLIYRVFAMIILFEGVKGAAKNYDQILKSLKYPEKLVFDVTNPLNKKFVIAPSEYSFAKSLDEIDVRLSPILFYTPAESIHSSFVRDASVTKRFKIIEPVINLPVQIRTSRIVTQSREVLKAFLLAKQSSSMPIKTNLGLTNVTIINIDIPLDGFILSYSGFKSKLREVLNRKYEDAQIARSNLTVFVKLNFLRDDQGLILSDELYRKYYFYFLQFIVFWLNDDATNEGIILEPFHNTLVIRKGFAGTPLNELLALKIDSKLTYGAIGLKAVMDEVSQNFNSVTMERTLLGRIQTDKCILSTGNGTGCPEMESKFCNRPIDYTSMLNINLRYYVGTTLNFKDEFRNLGNALTGLPWKLFEIYMLKPSVYPRTHLSELTNQINELHHPDVSLACGSQSWAENERYYFISTTKEACNFIWEQTKVFLWSICFHEEIEMNDLLRRLTLMELERQEFLKEIPGKSVKLRVRLEDKSTSVNGASCNPQVKAMNEKAEVVMNFARIHNLSIEIIYKASVEGWRPLQVANNIEKEKLKFPVHVFRDFPEKFLLGDFHTDPCLSWTDKLPKAGIVLDSNYAGTTLYMAGLKNEPINSDELETLLRFAFHKFSLVELVPETSSDLETVIGKLSQQRLVKQLEVDGSKPAKLYLKIDQDKINVKDGGVLKKLAKVTENSILSGIHFASKNRSLDISNSDFGKLKFKNIAIGISLEDCVDEVNNHFRNIRDSLALPQMDYLLCNIKDVIEANNGNRQDVAKYLDTTLYIQKYFQRMFPNKINKEILFRLNSVPSMHGENRNKNHGMVVSNFLKFFSDVGRYASQNKMKLFMLPTFDDMTGSKFGWWGITNSSSISNTSFFIEKEADYLASETWRPSPEVPTDAEYPINIEPSWFFYAGLSCGLVFAILICILPLRFCHLKQFTLLTKEEVSMFRYGDEQNTEVGTHSGYDSRKFPEEFSIAKGRFLLTSIIGKGIFGVVCNATLLDQTGNKATSVLVKTPHPDCSKEEFKRMLFELKVLCCVGSHPHVLQFVGAYVDEIGKGVLYIATAFCENGSLQDYLRKLNTQLTRPSMLAARKEKGTKEIELVEYKPDLNELTRFAHEIALGMEYIASKNIVHGDLSTRNVLLDANQQCKIADVAGLSTKMHEVKDNEKNKRGNFVLPWRWWAVESLKKLEFTTKSDVWSYGVTLWAIFSLGSVPYPGRSNNDKFLEDIENGFQMPAPTFSTDVIYETMKQCWDINPEERPTFTGLSQFFCKVRDGTYNEVQGKTKLTVVT